MQMSTTVADTDPRAGAIIRKALFLAAAVSSLLVLPGCDMFLLPEEEPEVASIIQSVDAIDGAMTVDFGSPPEDPGAPRAQASGNQSMIPGGGTGFTVTADEPFSEIFAWVHGRDGYYRLEFDSPRDSAHVILTYGHDLPDSQYDFRFGVGTGGGVGEVAARAMSVITVGTGDVQVSVSWDAPSDVDLYVVDPDGEEIFYGNRTSASGGELDLDSNAACQGEDARNENVTWPEGEAPRGEYTVRVNYWSDCDESETNWVVTIRVEGEPTRTHTGTFTGEGNGGHSGAGAVVTTFTY